MKNFFLKIKGLGVISDSWMVNNKGDVIHSQVSGTINKKMIAEMSQSVIQLLSLQSSYIGGEVQHIYLNCDDLTIYAFDMDTLVLIAISSNAVDSSNVLDELSILVEEFATTSKLISKYGKKNIQKRDMITKLKLDEKAHGLLTELRRSDS